MSSSKNRDRENESSWRTRKMSPSSKTKNTYSHQHTQTPTLTSAPAHDKRVFFNRSYANTLSINVTSDNHANHTNDINNTNNYANSSSFYHRSKPHTVVHNTGIPIRNSHPHPHPHSHNQRNKKIICSNCKQLGHKKRDCPYPIASYGVIALSFPFNISDFYKYTEPHQIQAFYTRFEINLLESLQSEIGEEQFERYIKFIDKNLKFLLIRRRNSISYIEFIRGNYDLEDKEYIVQLLRDMSVDELNNIKDPERDFNELWKNLWNEPNEILELQKNNLIRSKNKFRELVNGYTNDSGKKYSLAELVDNVKFFWKEPEWGFPKGRRNSNETEWKCANREFQEETNLSEKDYFMLDQNTIYEKFQAVNGQNYKHVYYIGQTYKNKLELSINPSNRSQSNEVGDIQWFSFFEARNHIRKYSKAKLMLTSKLYNVLKYVIICGMYRDGIVIDSV